MYTIKRSRGLLLGLLVVMFLLLLPPQVSHAQSEEQEVELSRTPSEEGAQETSESNRTIEIGRPMPSFTVHTLDGQQINSDDLRGKHVVINWWATWCAPCLKEMPGLNRLVEDYGEHSDLVFLAIARNTVAQLESFFETHEFAYQQAIFNHATTKIFGGAYPRNVIVDADGMVVFDELGGAERQADEIEAALHEYILN